MAALAQVTRNAVVQRDSSDPAVTGLAFATYAFISGLAGANWKGRRFRKRALALLENVDDDTWHAAICQNLGASYFVEADCDQADQWLRKSLHTLEQMRDWQYSFSLHWLRHLYSFMGEADQIVDFGRQELDARPEPEIETSSAGANMDWPMDSPAKGQVVERLRNGIESWTSFGPDNVSSVISAQEIGRASLQASEYEIAASILGKNFNMPPLLAFFEPTFDTFALFAEADIGPNWWQPNQSLERKIKRRIAWNVRICQVLAFLCPTMKTHGHRVAGRWAWLRGKQRKAVRHPRKARDYAEQVGAQYELARALLDLAAISAENRDSNRQRARECLRATGSVIPYAERQLLGDEPDKKLLAPSPESTRQQLDELYDVLQKESSRE